MLSVLIILKYIVCVIFFATVVLVCFYIPPDSFEGFIYPPNNFDPNPPESTRYKHKYPWFIQARRLRNKIIQ